MDFALSDEQLAYQDAARTFAQKELWPQAAKWDEEKHFPKDVIQRAGEMGFCGIYTSEDMGGLGLKRQDAAIIFEELAAGCAATTAYITIHNMVTWMLDRFAKPEVRAQFVPLLASGQKLGSYCLSEPWSGSDAAALKTTATKQGDKYVLKGTKAWVSGGNASDVYIVMARTGAEGPKGISSFLVPAGLKGISYGANEKKLGWNCQPTMILNLDNVEIPASHLLGEEGEGFKIAMQGLDGGRINIGICSVGAAQAAMRETVRYMNERKQFGKPLADFQGLQFRVADMATELVAARQMIRLAADKLDKKDPQASVYCAMAKRFATDIGWKICDEAIQLHGGYGYTKEYPLERLMRDTRVHRILEGTNEVMRVIIARKVLDSEAFQQIR
jgi:alkylation response protein AidB-like acyl-CoA dehydrogenase